MIANTNLLNLNQSGAAISNQTNQAELLLYQCFTHRGLGDRLRSFFRKDANNLSVLDENRPRDGKLGFLEAASQSVPLSLIRGSANPGRARDFDTEFRPLQDHNKNRWLKVAAARKRGVKLPPVSLIQARDTYFVQDGHHRISVALALGDEHIKANVVVL